MRKFRGSILFTIVLFLLSLAVRADEIVYSQGFEADNGSYGTAGSAQWAWGTPTVVGPSSAHSGLYCWGTNLSGTIPALANGSLTSPAIAVRSVGANETVRASFWLYSYLSTMQDRGEFQTSSDGTNWTSVLKFYEQMSGGWQRYEFDVTSYAGGNLYLRFIANKAYSSGGATPGLYVDDVAVTIRTKPDAPTIFTLVGYEDPSSFSSCPWVHTWDGTKFVRDNDIFPVGRYPNGEYTDHYLLQKPLVARDGRYDLEVREIESEDSWTDMLGLLAVDHQPWVGIGPDQGGRVHAYERNSLVVPASALDGAGKSVLPEVMTRDDSGYPGDDGGRVDLDFSGVDLTEGAHLLVRVKGFIQGTGEFRPYSGPPAVVVQVAAPDGAWREAGRLLPRFEWSEGVFDLAPFLGGRTDGVRVRLVSISHAAKYHEIDHVALAPGREPVFRCALQPLSSAAYKGADVRTALEAVDGIRVVMHPDESMAVSFLETDRDLPERELIFISRGYYVPRGGTFLIYTWDGTAWVQRDARSTTGSSDSTMTFDLGLFLPDPAGDFKVRVWQDFKYEGARIDYAGLVAEGTSGTLSYARDLRGGSSVDIIGQTQAVDGARLTYGSGNRDRWSEYRWSGISTVLPPTTNPVSIAYPNISWTYSDPQSLPQANYYIEVWTGSGGSGTIMWNPAMGSGTETSATYAGASLTPSATYYVRVRANNGTVWGGWSEGSFVAPGTAAVSVSAVAGANGALDASTPSPESVAPGETASFKFNAAAGYHVASVSGCDGTSYVNTSNSVTTYTYTTGPISSACTVTAGFAVNTYTITATSGANGRVLPAGVTTVNYDGSQTYTIAADSGYHIEDVLVDGDSVGAVSSHTFSAVRATHTIEASFAADPTAPAITTTSVTAITATTASSGGKATSDGSSAITARGVCWGVTAGPTTADSHTHDGSGTGVFASAMAGLSPNTTYHVRAYATNGIGTAYGEDLSFTTAANPAISGTVRDSEGVGLEGATMMFSGEAGSASTGVDGRYSRVVDHGWTGTITPSLPGYSFEPASRSITNVTEALEGQDFTVRQGAPRVSILKPSDGSRLAGAVEVRAKAEDPDGISRTEIFIDGVRKATAGGPACSFSWDTAAAAFGKHGIRAVARDAFGLASEVEIRVTVDNPPRVTILSPSEGQTVFGGMSVTASASDDESIVKVGFFVDGRGIGEGTPAAAGSREIGAGTGLAGAGAGRYARGETGGSSAQVATGGDMLVYIDALGRLRKMGTTGAPERVLKGDPGVLYVRPDAGNTLFVVYEEPRSIDGGASGRIGAVDLRGNGLAAVEAGELRIRTDFPANPAIQFDGLGNAYYVVRTGDGTESLKAWDSGREATTLFGGPVRIGGWWIDKDGTALVYGSEGSGGPGWLYRIDRSGNRVSVVGPGIETRWALRAADGGICVRLADPAVNGIYRLQATDSLLTESRARAPLIGRANHRFSPCLGTDELPEPARSSWDGLRLAGWANPAGGRLFALLKGEKGESLVLELGAKPRPIDVRGLDEISLIEAAGDVLLVSGTNRGEARLLSIDLATGRETCLSDDGLRIDRMAVLADGRAAFQGYFGKAGRSVIGVLTGDPGGKGRSGYQILAVLGPGAPLGFDALNGAGSAAATGPSGTRAAVPASGPLSGAAGPRHTREGGAATSGTVFSAFCDTLSLANGTHEIKAVATDPAGQTSSDTVIVNVQNLSLTVEALRRQASAWLISRDYGEIRISALNPGAIPVAKYILYRKAGAGSQRALKEYPAGQVGPSGVVYLDKYLDRGVPYSYQAVAVLADGSVAGSSPERTI